MYKRQPTNHALSRMLTTATGAVMIALPPLRLFAAGGPSWGEAWVAHQPIMIALDLVLAATGAWLVVRCVARGMSSARGPAGAVEARA